jgi:hypothetical protein
VVVLRIGRWSFASSANGDGGGSAVSRARRDGGPIYSQASERAVRARHCNDEGAAWVRGTVTTRLVGRDMVGAGLANGERGPAG